MTLAQLTPEELLNAKKVILSADRQKYSENLTRFLLQESLPAGYDLAPKYEGKTAAERKAYFEETLPTHLKKFTIDTNRLGTIVPVPLENGDITALIISTGSDGKLSATYVDPAGLNIYVDPKDLTIAKKGDVLNYSTLPAEMIEAVTAGLGIAREDIFATVNKIQPTLNKEDGKKYTYGGDTAAYTIDTVSKILSGKYTTHDSGLGVALLQTYDNSPNTSIENIRKSHSKILPQQEQKVSESDSAKKSQPQVNPFSTSSILTRVVMASATLAAAAAKSVRNVPSETNRPSLAATARPTLVPTTLPTDLPTNIPTILPSEAPTFLPSTLPTIIQTASPTAVPSISPSEAPTVVPTRGPTFTPSQAPTTVQPSAAPSLTPTSAPTSATPTTASPSTRTPTLRGTAQPTNNQTSVPTFAPTFSNNITSSNTTLSSASSVVDNVVTYLTVGGAGGLAIEGAFSLVGTTALEAAAATAASVSPFGIAGAIVISEGIAAAAGAAYGQFTTPNENNYNFNVTSTNTTSNSNIIPQNASSNFINSNSQKHEVGDLEWHTKESKYQRESANNRASEYAQSALIAFNAILAAGALTATVVSAARSSRPRSVSEDKPTADNRNVEAPRSSPERAEADQAIELFATSSNARSQGGEGGRI